MKKILSNVTKVIEVPINFIRDYTCPMAEHSEWNRTRAAVIPMTLVISFFYLAGSFNEGPIDENPYFWVGIACIFPGTVIGTLIYLKTKVSRAPEWLMSTFAAICFVMSILWIKFSADCIMDLLELFGFIS